MVLADRDVALKLLQFLYYIWDETLCL